MAMLRPDPLEDDLWDRIREAYNVIQRGEADNLTLEEGTHVIEVWKGDFGIMIEVNPSG